MKTVYTPLLPEEMVAGPVDEEGWIEWKPMHGTLQPADYHKLEREFKVKFPPSFIEWHSRYFFADGDCAIMRLPTSIPIQPLKEIRRNLDWFIASQIIPQKNIYFRL